MLTMMPKSDIPDYRGRGRSPLRRFAKGALDEFLERASPGGAAEVTGAPEEPGRRGVAPLAEAFKQELYLMYRADPAHDVRDRVRVVTRGGERVFLVMEK